MNTGYWIAAALLVALIYVVIRFFVKSAEKFGGEQVIICPETKKQAMVEVDATHAALTSLLGRTDLRLESCWRWPLRENCGQECLLQLDVAPPECLVRSVLEKWYLGKCCAFCKTPFAEIALTDHEPALLAPDGNTVEWTTIPIAGMVDVLANYQPVCWNCHVAQSFRRDHPDLVVYRSFRQPSCSRAGAPR
jgi:hypothetical protein